MPKLPRQPGEQPVIGIIPAGGRATRLQQSPCSKEILPVGVQDAGGRQSRLKVASEYLLQSMIASQINIFYMVIRSTKWDIPAYFAGCPLSPNAHLAYLVNEGTPGVPYTIDQAYPFVHDKRVAIGFPDILFNEKQAFEKLLDHLDTHQAEVVLGLFPADQPERSDLVECGDHHKVRRVVVKPTQTDLKYTWGIAVWTPVFSEFLHRFLRDFQPEAGDIPPTAGHQEHRELHLGDVIQAAVEKNINVNAIQVSDEPYIDIGRIDNYIKALQRYAPG